jgi:predicted hydrocarbon binding protein/glutaredoxin
VVQTETNTESNLREIYDFVPTRVILFTAKHCVHCKKAKEELDRSLTQLGDLSGMFHISILDVEEEEHLGAYYNVTNLPALVVGDIVVDQGPMEAGVISSHLWKNIISSSTERIMAPDGLTREILVDTSINLLQSVGEEGKRIRPNMGDYVHCSHLQLRSLSILALDEIAGSLLYNLGKAIGKVGGYSGWVFALNPSLLKAVNRSEYFTEGVRGVERLYDHDMALGLYSARDARLVHLEEDNALLRINESALSTGVPAIGESLCHYEAGKIAGLLEAITSEETVVFESNCWGMGDRSCQFEIMPKEKYERLKEDKAKKEAAKPEEDEEEKKEEEEQQLRYRARPEIFTTLLKTILRNIKVSVLEGREIRSGVMDNVHITTLQQQFTVLKLADPIDGALMYAAGKKVGDLIQKTEFRTVKNTPSPNESITLIERLFNSPLFLLSGDHLKCEGTAKKDEITFKVFECADASGISNVGLPLCDYKAGVLAGIIEKLTKKHVTAQEVKCPGLGDKHCEFSLTLD